MMLTAILFIVILGVLVFVHEFGHFNSARRLGVTVEEFGFGFPPKLFSIKKKDTVYSINLIPFGGFVRLRGEQGDAADDPTSFTIQAAWKKLAILLSGVGMNILLAAVLFGLVFTIGVPAVFGDSEIPSGGKLVDPQLQILEVIKDSPSSIVGLKQGDVLISLDGTKVTTIDQVHAITLENGETPTTIVVERDNVDLSFPITPRVNDAASQPSLGIAIAETGRVVFPWYKALWLGPWYALRILGMIFVSLWDIIHNLFIQGGPSVDVSGPIGIAVLTGQVAHLGFVYIIQFAGLLSLSLAAMNVLPLPALDGGRAFFVLLEKVRHRPISPKIENMIHSIGFYALIALIMVISYRDLFKFGISEKIGDYFKNLGI